MQRPPDGRVSSGCRADEARAEADRRRIRRCGWWRRLRRGATGATIRIGGFFSGPLPLALRLLGIRSKRARLAAAASALLGSLITRLAWIEAGKASARDPRPHLQ